MGMLRISCAYKNIFTSHFHHNGHDTIEEHIYLRIYCNDIMNLNVSFYPNKIALKAGDLNHESVFCYLKEFLISHSTKDNTHRERGALNLH
jgi:hypothetical protein